jgi:hydrogenase maturation protease
MNRPEQETCLTVVAGFGSPHGDDQAGWRVAAMLARRPDLLARVIAVHEPTQVLAALGDARRLIVVDACQTGEVAGAITHLTWPDPRIVSTHRHSTHGVGVADLLKLADQLQCLPTLVELFGIEVADCSPGRDLTPAVVRSVAEVEARIANDLCEVAHA